MTANRLTRFSSVAVREGLIFEQPAQNLVGWPIDARRGQMGSSVIFSLADGRLGTVAQCSVLASSRRADG